MTVAPKSMRMRLALVVALAAAAGFFWFGFFERPEAMQLPPSAFEVRVRLRSLESDRPKSWLLQSSAGFHIDWDREQTRKHLDWNEAALALETHVDSSNPNMMLAVRLPNGERQPRLRIRCSEEDGWISLADRIYSGELIVEVAGDLADQHDDTFLRITVRVPVEHYLAGVVGPEISARSAMPALEAQAIAARSYVAHRMSRRGLIEDTASSQVYRGLGVLDRRVLTALHRTAGKILSMDGEKPLATFYHSTCGGHTARGADVFPIEADPIPGIASPDCEGTSHYRWSYSLDREQCRRLMQHLKLGTELRSVQAKTRDAASGRWLELRIEGDSATCNLSWSGWKSACADARVPVPKDLLWLDVSVGNGTLAVNGGGYGHGVGMCQMCARRMGDRGASAEEILARFYPGARIHLLKLETTP